MDFAFTPEQEAVRDLARRILGDRLTQPRLRAVEAEPDWFDRDAWAELAKTNLLGIALPETHGGGGLGFLELGLVLEAVGWTAAPLPAWATLVCGALPIGRFGSRSQQEAWLPGVARGDVVLGAGLVEDGNDDPLAPATTAKMDGAGWRLDGTKHFVSAAHLAARLVVPARTPDGTGLFLVDPTSRGVTLERQVVISGEPQHTVTLAGAAGEALGGGAAAVAWTWERAVAGLCAFQAGVVDRALRMTAEYTSKREQFNKPLATFQAVAQRAADAYIDVEAIRWTAWQAVWRLAEELPAADEVAIAKFWASDAGHRIVYAATHLHGGMGIDLDYPLHRYYLRAKHVELALGSAERHLLRLGAEMAR
jgi:alkylation response protein AidB-like acyl-CoA dehydrogenase